MSRALAGPFCLLALAAGLAAIGAFREFPLDDGWAYFIAVRGLLEDGALRIPDIVSPTAVAHIAWGALWANIFGLSHSTLRASTIALGALALALTLVMNEDRPTEPTKDGGRSALGLSLIGNPMFVILCLTAMTDVPYLAWFLLSIRSYQRAQISDRGWDWVAASFVAAIAYLVRQLGVLIPLGVLLALASQGKLTRRRAALALLPCVAVAAAHQYWFRFVHGENWAAVAYAARATSEHLASPGLLWESYRRVAGAALYLCLFTAPLALGGIRGWKRPSPSALALGFAAFLPLLADEGAFPYFLSLIHEAGLGTPTIPGLEAKRAGLLGSPLFHAGLSLAALGSWLVWLGRGSALRVALAEPSLRLLVVCALLQFPPALAGRLFFDRYLLPLLPAALLLAARASLPSRAALAGAAALLCWSLAGAADYLNWSEARWEAGHAAERAGIPPERLLNGGEWNGLLSYEREMARLKESRPLAAIGEWDWLDLAGMRAASSFSPHSGAGAAVLLSVPYRTPLSREPGRIYVHGAKR